MSFFPRDPSAVHSMQEAGLELKGPGSPLPGDGRAYTCPAPAESDKCSLSPAGACRVFQEWISPAPGSAA